ncbi:MAG: hypothetical protein HY435_02280 [Candidatus Liptonbacteria bacterium]|nr:hypothetical protein [Candidatus Liptonbacteria bacterium]
MGKWMIEKIPDDLSREIFERAEQLKKEGYEFDLEETADEMIIRHGAREVHFLKLDPYPNQKGSKLLDVLENWIVTNVEKK